jgi:hypothetical protein
MFESILQYRHPLATEKLFILSINEGNDFDLVFKGKASITGCDLSTQV